MHGDALPGKSFRRGTRPLYDDSTEPTADSQTSLNTQSPPSPSPSSSQKKAPPASGETTIQVPLPTEVPPAPNLSALPTQILHSGTVETLIGQNEDLMARLKVNLRRNAILESQILGLERELASLRQINTTLRDQTRIIQEKDKVWKEKNARIESRYESMREQITFLRKQLGATERYLRRVRRWVQPALRNTRAALKLEHHRQSELSALLASRDAQIGDLRARLEDLGRYIQEREKAARQDQTQLVDTYETKLTTLTEANEKISADLRFFRERAQRLDEMTLRQVDAENRAILLERKNQELERKLNTEMVALQSQTTTYRSEAKALAAELESLRVEMAKLRNEKQTLDSDNSHLRDQLETLQVLWTEKVKEREALERRLDSLNKINQELSRKLKEQKQPHEPEPGAEATHGLPLSDSAAAARMHELNVLSKETAADINPESTSDDDMSGAGALDNV